MATLEQARAAFALEKVRGIEENREKFKTQLLKLPARLHANGLGQTVAFYLSAGEEKPEWIICGWLEEWLRRPEQVYGEQRLKGMKLVECITGSRLPEGRGQSVEDLYQQASVEARALSIWLKRFAEAFLK